MRIMSARSIVAGVAAILTFAIFAGNAGLAMAQTAGTTVSPLNCVTASATNSCNAKEVNGVSYKLVNEIDPCTGPTDSGRADIDITFTTNAQRYDFTSITSVVGENVGGGTSCAETYLGNRTAGTYTQRTTLSYKCVDSNNNGVIDISSVFNWFQTAGNYITPVSPSGTPQLNTPKCYNPGYVDIEGLAFVNPPGANFEPAGTTTDHQAAEGTDTGSFPIALVTQPTANVTVTFGTDSQCNFTPSPITFTPADWNVPQTITVTPIDDSLLEGPHSCTPVVTFASSDAGYNGLQVTAPTTSVADNDVAGLTFTPSADDNATEAPGDTGSFPISLTTQPTADVVITLTGDGQCTFDPSPVTFTAANWNVPQTITVTPIDDNVAEGDHTCTPTLSIASADPTYDNLSNPAPATNVIDNDTASVSYVDPNNPGAADGNATEAPGDTGSFPLVLTSKPAADVVITLASDGQCTFDPSPVTFTAANWDQVQTITATPIDDKSVEGNHTCSPIVTVTSADPAYNDVAAPAPATDIVDNDTAGISFVDPNNPGAADGNATEAPGDTGSFPLVLTSKPAADVVITLASDGQCTFDPSPVTFTAANWDQVQTITATPVDDKSVEGNPKATTSSSTVATIGRLSPAT